jgi:alpha-glucosidase
MRTYILLAGFLLGSTVPVRGEPDENRVESPNGNICAQISVSQDGIPEFEIFFKGSSVTRHNKLGIVRADADFSRDLKLASVSAIEKIEDHYSMLYGKKLNCSYRGNRKTFHFENKAGREIDIIFQLSDDGVAFRYFFPGEPDGMKKISSEETFFNFGDSTIAWIQPMSKAKSGWEKVNPAYEEHYYCEVNVKNLPAHKPGWVFPALFRSGKCWIALTEAGLDRNYCGCRLLHDSASAVFKIGFPDSAEVIFNGPLDPEWHLPLYSPWRIIALSDNLGTLVESTLGTDLAKPSTASDNSYVKPGRSSWSWVLFKDDSTIYSVQKRFIDYAADMGWEYCLIDAFWDTKIGYEKIGELCSYAKSKRVGITLWYNSAGDWNTAPLTPRNKLLTKELREAEFDKITKLGVSGIKVDFFGGDGQSVMSYYQDIIEDAARHHLMVNCHGATLPRGWERTYPNLVTMEAVKGFEYVTFDQPDADKEASHCATLPFARNLFDPMDFTPVCFSEVPHIQRKTTNSFELALSVLFLSGIQHFAEVPEGMAKVPPEVKQMMKEIPVAWDESRFIDGYPGKYVIVARRKENTWYVAGINGEPTGRDISIDLGFIKTPSSRILFSRGADDRSFSIEKEVVDTAKPLVIRLNPRDGFVCQITMPE